VGVRVFFLFSNEGHAPYLSDGLKTVTDQSN